jgi:hypothetical protein
LDRLEPPVLRTVVWLVVWLGNARKNLKGFPEGAQKLLGDELQLIQFGGMPKDAKPFKGVGSGVLRLPFATPRTPTALSRRYNWAREFMCCTRFRRNRRKASQHRNGTWT